MNKTLNKKDLALFAVKLAKSISPKDCILLKGDLGAGKTFFAKNFISSFYEAEIEVNSPSFNIVQTYLTKSFTIWHFDLYRLKSFEEIFEIGIEQALDEGVSIIEWPEIAGENFFKNYIEIKFDFTNDQNIRLISLRSNIRLINNLSKRGEI